MDCDVYRHCNTAQTTRQLSTIADCSARKSLLSTATGTATTPGTGAGAGTTSTVAVEPTTGAALTRCNDCTARTASAYATVIAITDYDWWQRSLVQYDWFVLTTTGCELS